MSQLPKNPLEPANLGQLESDEAAIIFDRIRRNYELTEGSPVQEDASFADRVELSPGEKVTVEINPAPSKEFIVDEVNVQPTLIGADYKIVADDTSTDASILPFGVPTRIHNKIQIEITNSNGSTERFQIVTDARQVEAL